MLELSKKDKKAARQIIEKGLLLEFEHGIQKIEKIIAQWQADNQDSRKTYVELYKTLQDHDKHISRRYDYMTGSKYILILVAQFMDGVISQDDLNILNEETKQYIIAVAKNLAGERE
jgi:hypothetical protein